MTADRRSIYFTFQGLLMAVLLLVFLYQHHGIAGWTPKFALLVAVFGTSLIALRAASHETLTRWWVQASLFLADVLLASLTLYWTKTQSDLYLIYFLIIFGTALTRSPFQSLMVAAVTSLLYLLSNWRGGYGFPQDTGFWLRAHLLWVTSALLAILSRDFQLSQQDHERRHRERLVQLGRLATLGQIAGEVAHRIKGPLTTILVNAEVLSHQVGKSKELRHELDRIREEVEHCKEILKDLLDIGRLEEMDLARIDLRDPIRSAIHALEPQLAKHAVRLAAGGLESPLPVRADQSLLHEAIAAVLQNAIDANPGGGMIRLRVRARNRLREWLAAHGPKHYELVIEDMGKGITPEDLERVFEPFFTTKGEEGSGLGLSAALRILQNHHGSIEAFSEGPGQGARFVLTIPKAGRER